MKFVRRMKELAWGNKKRRIAAIAATFVAAAGAYAFIAAVIDNTGSILPFTTGNATAPTVYVQETGAAANAQLVPGNSYGPGQTGCNSSNLSALGDADASCEVFDLEVTKVTGNLPSGGLTMNKVTYNGVTDLPANCPADSFVAVMPDGTALQPGQTWTVPKPTTVTSQNQGSDPNVFSPQDVNGSTSAPDSEGEPVLFFQNDPNNDQTACLNASLHASFTVSQ